MKRAFTLTACLALLGTAAWAERGTYKNTPDPQKVLQQEKLGPAEAAGAKNLQTYLANELRSLGAAGGNANPMLGNLNRGLSQGLADLGKMDLKKSVGLGGLMAQYAEAYAYYQDLVDPNAIHLTDRFWEEPNLPQSTPGDNDKARAYRAFENRERTLRMQLWYAERASLMLHEMVHAGKIQIEGMPLNARGTQGPNPPSPEEVQLPNTGIVPDSLPPGATCIQWGTDDAGAYSLQYVVLRLLLDKTMSQYEKLRADEQQFGRDNNIQAFGDNVSMASSVLSNTIARLIKEGVIDAETQTKLPANLNSADNLRAALKIVDGVVKKKYGVDLPDTANRPDTELPAWPPRGNSKPGEDTETASNFSGKWTCTDSKGNRFGGTLDLTQSGQKLTGALQSAGGKVPITSGSINGNKMVLHLKFDNAKVIDHWMQDMRLSSQLVGITAKIEMEIGKDPKRLSGYLYPWNVTYHEKDGKIVVTRKFSDGADSSNPKRPFTMSR